MPLRTSPVGHPGSSSSHAFNQSTPALEWDSDARRWGRGESSSPAAMLLATPSDAGAAARGKAAANNNGKQEAGHRRSVRVRQASGHYSATSSPQPFHDATSLHYANIPTQQSARPRPSRVPSSTNLQHATSTAHGAIADPPLTRSRAPAGLTRSQSDFTSHTRALAQSHGISPEQFEEAKQQMMYRFGPNSNGGGQVLSSPSAVMPGPGDKGKGKQQHQQHSLGRSQSYTQGAHAGAASMATVGSASTHTSPIFTPAQPPRSRSRHVPPVPVYQDDRYAYYDVADPAEVASRSSRKEQEKEANLRRWAQESSSSSDEEDSTAQSAAPASASRTAPGSGSSSSLMPSPFASVPMGDVMSGPAPSPSALLSSVSKRGIMERFMTDRTPQSDKGAGEQEILQQQQQQAQVVDATQRKRTRRAGPATRSRDVSPVPASAPHSLMSPARSKRVPPGPSVLFSPDVARLLRSELDQLEAKEHSHLSPQRKSHAQADDIRVDDFASPLTEIESPYPQSASKRSQSNYSPAHQEDGSAGKRARWTDFAPQAHDEAPADQSGGSPSPSASMRAPSFCDSSPSMSDHASVPGSITAPSAARQSSGSLPAQHPASAPELIFGLPSSSPGGSSQHSSASEYAPSGPTPRHRSSPGPISRTIQRSASNTSAIVDTSLARKGRNAPALKRADTAPAIVSADGYAKPSFSYAALIGQAIFSTPDMRMSLADVYGFIMTTYPYYRKEDQGWQNSIRHNLSLNECFVKTVRGLHQPGKGCLWAIAAGCEEQFANGGFVKRGSQGQTRKPKGARVAKAADKAAQAAAAATVPSGTASDFGASQSAPALSRSSSKRSRDESPTVAPEPTRCPSPALSAGSSAASSYRNSTTVGSQYSARAPSPSPSASASTSTAGGRKKRPSRARQPAAPRNQVVTSASVLEQHFDAPRVASPAPSLAPSASTCDLDVGLLSPGPQHEPVLSAPASLMKQEAEEERPAMDLDAKRLKLEEPYQQQPRMTRRTSSSRLQARQAQNEGQQRDQQYAARPTLAPAFSTRDQLLLRQPAPAHVAASPPTSVYHRLAGPYQPIVYSQSSNSHRALALLASPEASGILPIDQSEYSLTRGAMQRQQQQQQRASGHSHSLSSSSIDSATGLSHFLPAPQIFPGSASGHRRARSDDKEEKESQNMLSPTALVHTQSPISSVRGGPRAPMSPLQASRGFSSTSALADPEKKPRAPGMRHIPAVAALADEAAFSADAFRSPPPASRGHLRSPSAKSSIGDSRTAAALFSHHQQNIMSTPGARSNGRLWGMSPGVGGVDSGTGGWSSWGDSLEAELERFGAGGEQGVLGSGGSVLGGPRLYWSPGVANHGAW